MQLVVLENKVAIVTGASSGIGYTTSLALSNAGLRVAAGARRIDRLKELERKIKKFSFKSLMLQGNSIVFHLLMQ